MFKCRFLGGKVDLWIFEIPEMAGRYKISGSNYLCYKNKYTDKWEVEELLPQHSEMVGRLSLISEEIADSLVERHGIYKGEVLDDGVVVDKDVLWGYKNYVNNMTLQPHEFETAKESLMSLFESNHCDMSKDYFIIKIKNDITMSWQDLAKLLDNASWDLFKKYYGDDIPKYGFRELFPVICNREELDTLLNKYKR